MKVFFLSLLAAGALADDFKLVHDRTRALFVSTAPATIAAARAALSSQNATCFWPDIDYFDRSRAVWQPATHIQRLSTMAQALTSYGSPLFDDTALAKGLHCGLSVWLTRKPRFSSANWWWAWIGEELTLQPIYLLLGANRTTPEEAASFYAFSLSSAWWEDTWGGGDNLSDMLRVQLYRGLASGNVSAVAQSFNVTYATIAVMSAVKGEEGIVPDQSYHFHSEQMLSSSYGAGWVCTVLNAFRLTRGTTFTMPQQAVAVLARFLVEGDAMVTFGRRWDWGTQGRGIDRPGTNFGWAFDPPTVLALAEEPGAAPWAAALAQFARSLGGDGPGLVGTRVFWLTDYVAHKRPTWGAAFKAYGNNGLFTVTGNEADNSENVMGEFSAAGVLNVYSSAEPDHAVEAYANIFPLWDWVRINGVTVEALAPAPPDGSNWPVINTAFVGGATDGASAAVAHDTALHALTARRAFFLFDSAVVGLIVNLTCLSRVPVRTTLASRQLPLPASGDPRALVAVGFSNGTVERALPDGNYSFPAGAVAWLNAGGLGVLPDPTLPLGVEVGNKTGSWSAIGPFHGTVEGRLWSAWVEHGARFAGAAAGYTLAPNTTAGDMPAAAATRAGAACVVNTPELQGAGAAALDGGGLLASVVWARGGAATPHCATVGVGFAVDGDGVFLLRLNASHAVATASHPALWAAGEARQLTLDRPLKSGEGCTASGALQLTLPPAGDLMGSSVARACELAQP